MALKYAISCMGALFVITKVLLAADTPLDDLATPPSFIKLSYRQDHWEIENDIETALATPYTLPIMKSAIDELLFSTIQISMGEPLQRAGTGFFFEGEEGRWEADRTFHRLPRPFS